MGAVSCQMTFEEVVDRMDSPGVREKLNDLINASQPRKERMEAMRAMLSEAVAGAVGPIRELLSGPTISPPMNEAGK